MRPIDFIIFYMTANYTKRKTDSQLWSTPLRRSVALAALSISLFFYIMAELTCYLIFNINILESALSIITLNMRIKC